ncbi:helix-turn-helix domain-containing protein [Solidesulfovibrio sp.]|uniref:helix-turn-helix domain-containing protein n=1 Tax=Solidesulfovibrio sp. TaxID=2910990 RepID=UPI002631583A|nr:helix-turn-helix domain-containing protein [Solidesulfovibrio sp.]
MTSENKKPATSDLASGFQDESLNSFDFAIKRLRLAINVNDIGELASFLGISRQAINKARSAKKIPPSWFIQVGQGTNVSIDWLVSGDGPMRRGETAVPATTSAPPTADAFLTAPQEEFRMSDMLTKTAEVLESDTIYRTALASNINAFHQAVRSERTLARLEERMGEIEAKADAMARELSELRRENRELKERLEPASQDKAVGAAG